MIPNFNIIYNFFKKNIFLDKNEKNFIKFNLKNGKKNPKLQKKKPSVILVDSSLALYICLVLYFKYFII